MASLLIIGASKGIGLETVKVALGRGHLVRAFARSATKIALENEHLEKFAGDARSTADIMQALTGMDCVIQSLGVSNMSELVFGTKLFSQATAVLVEQMQKSGPRKLLVVTGAGAGNSRGRINPLYDHLMFPVLLQRIYSDKDAAEDIITASGLDWTIARPGLLTDVPKTADYKVLPDMKDWRAGFASRANVADFLVNQAEEQTMRHKTPLIIN